MNSIDLTQAYQSLVSLDPKIRSNAAIRAVNQEFWLAPPPEWFSVVKYPNVIGFDEKNVIHGTNIRNIKIISWEQLRENDHEQVDSRKVAA